MNTNEWMVFGVLAICSAVLLPFAFGKSVASRKRRLFLGTLWVLTGIACVAVGAHASYGLLASGQGSVLDIIILAGMLIGCVVLFWPGLTGGLSRQRLQAARIARFIVVLALLAYLMEMVLA